MCCVRVCLIYKILSRRKNKVAVVLTQKPILRKLRQNKPGYLSLHSLSLDFSQCTKIYPMALIPLAPLSPLSVASFPHALESSGLPPVPNPILESQVLQSFFWLPRKPILALKLSAKVVTALKASLLQWGCKEASEPISVFHVSRPTEVARYSPSAISEYRELACLLMTMKLICWPIFIPRQILEKGVFQ